jgi:hypothetical protein
VGAVLTAGVVAVPAPALAAGAPERITIGAADVGSSVLLAALVRDGDGQPVAGALVTFTRSTPAGGTVTVGTAATGAGGGAYVGTDDVGLGGATYRALAAPALVAVTSLATTAAVPAGAPPLEEDRSVVLDGFRDLEVDDLNGRVFVSTGEGVEVFDSDGNHVRSLTVLGGAGMLAIAPDNLTLYVGLDNVGEVAVVDPESLVVVGRIPMPDGSGAAGGFAGLEATRDRLVASLHRGSGSSGLSLVPLGDPGTATFVSGSYDDGPLAVSPDGTEAVTLGTGSPSSARFWDVSGAAPVEDESVFHYPVGDPSSNAGDVDYLAGDRLLLASGAPYQGREVDRDGHDITRTFPVGPYPTTIEASRDGRYVAVGRDAYYESSGVRVFDRATATVVRDLPGLSAATHNLVAHGDAVRFSGDGSRLYAVHQSSPTEPATALDIYAMPTVSCSVTVTAARFGVGDRTIRVRGSVTGRGGPAVAGASVELELRADDTVVSSPTVVADGNGEFRYDATLSAAATDVVATAKLPVGEPCAAVEAVVPAQAPAAPPTVVAYGGKGGAAVFWVPPSGGTSPLLAQSILLVRDGKIVRWLNTGAADWYIGGSGLSPGLHYAFVIGWSEVGLGALSAPIPFTVT